MTMIGRRRVCLEPYSVKSYDVLLFVGLKKDGRGLRKMYISEALPLVEGSRVWLIHCQGVEGSFSNWRGMQRQEQDEEVAWDV